jgi:CheY-like chemotaxis protein
MHYRIALCGFSEFEHRALHFSFQNPAATDETQYDVVEALADADFAVVDADSSPAVKGVVLSGRLPHAVFVGSAAPSGAGAHVGRPIDPTRIRRELDQLAARHAEPRARLEPPPPDSVLPTLDDEIIILPPISMPTWVQAPTADVALAEPAPAGASPSAAAPAISQALADAKHAAKVAARAAARRRLAGDGTEHRAAEPLRDVLVFDRDEPAGMLLCDLLERFGFDAMWVHAISQANEQLGRRPFAAFFLDIALDGEGLALVQRIHELPPQEGYPAPAVLLVSAHLNPADRVRAALAGIKAPLTKPVSRGDVARALESCGVTLPADARRG